MAAFRVPLVAMSITALSLMSAGTAAAGSSGPRVLLVGSFHGVAGPFTDIQAAVNAARPGDWVLVGPGDYKASGRAGNGVLITTPGIHLRGMDRNRVIVDGTKPGRPACDAAAASQFPSPHGRNGIQVFEVNGVSVENLAVCNYLADPNADNGNEIWFNGGAGTGTQNMGAFTGQYLSATSTSFRGSTSGLAQYGIFAGNGFGPGLLAHTYASNMADAAYYIGACPDCHLDLTDAHGQNSALGYSGTNSGGHLVVENSEFDQNAAGIVPNSLNDDDAPSPQNGACPSGQTGPTGTTSCTVIRSNRIHDNNNPLAPCSGITCFVQIGAGIELVGASNDTVVNNTISNQGAWGIVIHDFLDTETPPPIAHCTGGVQLPHGCFFSGTGNLVADNTLSGNGFFGQAGNGDVGDESAGNCFRGNVDPTMLTSDPLDIQGGSGCGSGDPNLAGSVIALGCAVATPPTCSYPPITGGRMLPLRPQPSMPDPCAGVPANAFCDPAAGTSSLVRSAPDPPAAAGITVGTGAERATIVRDQFGVPSIYGAQLGGVWFGAGYAQAQDRLVQLELVRRAVQGTLSEIFGPSQLGQDETVRLFFYTPAEVQAQYDSMPAATRAAIRAYADGINAFLRQAYADPAHELTMVPYEFFVLGQLLGQPGPYRPADWQPADTVTVGNFLARDFGGGGGSELDNLAFLQYLMAELGKHGDASAATDAFAVFNDARWINDPTAPTTVPASGANGPGHHSPLLAPAVGSLSAQDVVAGAAALRRARDQIRTTGITLRVPWRDGSNAFVVAPSRSEDGNALLWGAPQEGFGTPSIDGEEYLHGPGYDAGGMDITGEPFILIGRNRNLAWTTTSEELVNQQIYVEQVNFATNPPSTRFDNRWVPMEAITETIPVAGQAPVTFAFFRSVHGPVFFADPSSAIAFAMKFASWGQETGSLGGFAEMGGDQNLNQYRESVSKVTTLHNFFYADRQGNIAYFGAGLVPILPACATCDPRLPHLGDGSQEWQGFEAFSELPHSINPAQGYLDNWNTKPDAAHFYQQNGGDEYWGTIFRSQRIAQMLQQNPRMDLNAALGVEQDVGTIDGDDTMRPAAPYFLPFIEAAYARLVASGDPLVDPTTHPDLGPAMAALQRWDQHTSLGSPAMTIFVESMEALQRNLFGGGLNPGELFTGRLNFADASLGAGTYLAKATYNLEYHVLAGTRGLIPCGQLCYGGDYFAGNRDRILVESLNDAVAILSGTGPMLGNGGAHGFGTADLGRWGWVPWNDINWDSLDPLAVGVATSCGVSPSQERSTYMQAIDLATVPSGVNVLPPGQSGFISAAGVPDPHLCDQVGLFNAFQNKSMPVP